MRNATLSLVMLAVVSAHESLGPPHLSAHDCSLDVNYQFQSYHIHNLFWSSDPLSTNTSLAIREDFIERFGQRDSRSNRIFIEDCPMSNSDPAPEQHQICSFGVETEPVGPFLTAQWAFFIPNDRFRQTVTWAMQHGHSDTTDTFIHGNSGYSTRDHEDWSLFGGNKWPLNLMALHS